MVEINLRELKKYANPFFLTIRKDKILVNNKRMARLSRTKMDKIEEEFGIPVIYSKTYEYVSTKVGRFINKHKIIAPRDIVIVGLSGGKDSLLLLHLLEVYRRKYGIKLIAVTVDVNIGGIRPWKEDTEGVKLIKHHCEMLNVPHIILKNDLDVVELSEILTKHSKGMEFSPCFSCSVIKRHLLGKLAKEIAENENIPHLFSIRVLKKMEKKGLLKIFKGANGGYKLNKEPKDITLRDAVETIEDEIIIKDRSCVVGQTSCSIIFKALEKVENNFLSNLEKVNFQELTCPTHVPLKIEDEIK